jgi:hypothetical protein
MTTEQFANGPFSTLNGAIASGAGSLVVTSATPYSGSPQFHIKIDQEIMLVTAVSGTTFTVTRAQEGTSAVSHVDGSLVAQIVSAAAIAQLKQDVFAPGIDTYVNRPAGFKGQFFMPKDGGLLQAHDGSAWRPIIGGCYYGTQPDLAANYTQVNANGNVTLADANGTLVVSCTGAAGTAFYGWVKTLSGTTVEGMATMSCKGITTSAFDYAMWYLVLRESGTGKAVLAGISHSADVNSTPVETDYPISSKWTNATTRTANNSFYRLMGPNGPVLIRAVWTAGTTQVDCYLSRDGQTWRNYSTIGGVGSNPFTTAPDQYGIAVGNEGANLTFDASFLSLKAS